MSRSSGVLMHVTSLPGSDSIGCFGKEARDFIDFLSDSGFTWWQVLPFCMADECNSPYKSYSAFGGNPYLVDLRILAAQKVRGEGVRTAAPQLNIVVSEVRCIAESGFQRQVLIPTGKKSKLHKSCLLGGFARGSGGSVRFPGQGVRGID